MLQARASSPRRAPLRSRVLTLELYILRRLVIGFLFACGAMTMVAIPCVLMHAVHKVAGVGMSAVLGFMPILMLELAPYLIPIGFLLALVTTYGRLAADNEWTAIQMTGVHPLKMLRPAALMAVVLSAALGYLAAEVSPTLNYRKRSYTKSQGMQLLRNLSPGRTEIKIGDFYLSARERDQDDRNRFRQVFLHLPADDDRPAQTLYAQSIEVELEGSIVWIDLTWPRWADEEYDMRVGNARLRIDLAKHSPGEERMQTAWRFQDSTVLAQRIDNTERKLAEGPAADFVFSDEQGYVEPKDLALAKFDLHSRRALAGICPMFLLLGIPTGLFLRRGSQLGAMAASIVYALLYYLISMRMGKVLGGSEAVPQWLAAWGATILGSVAGGVLLWRTLRR